MKFYKTSTRKINCIFCADFNFNTLIISPAESSKVNLIPNYFFSHTINGLLIVDFPTMVNKVTETCTLVDNIYTNYNNYLENCQSAILRTTFYDQYSNIAISKFSSITKQTSFVSRREFTKNYKSKAGNTYITPHQWTMLFPQSNKIHV